MEEEGEEWRSGQRGKRDGDRPSCNVYRLTTARSVTIIAAQSYKGEC